MKHPVLKHTNSSLISDIIFNLSGSWIALQLSIYVIQINSHINSELVFESYTWNRIITFPHF